MALTHSEALELIRKKLVMDHDATKDGTATVDSERIIREVAEAQTAENISNARLAKILRCSTATWSQIRGGKYKGDTLEYVKRARMWLEDAAARHEEPETPFVKTTIAGQILGVAKRAAEMPCIGLVIARSGVGKTASLLEFARLRPQRAVYLQAGEMLASPVMLLGEIAAKLGIPLVVVSSHPDESEARKNTEAAERYLHRFGAEVAAVPTADHPEKAILDSAREHACNLIVMGAYGHTHIRELILGTESRSLYLSRKP